MYDQEEWLSKEMKFFKIWIIYQRNTIANPWILLRKSMIFEAKIIINRKVSVKSTNTNFKSFFRIIKEKYYFVKWIKYGNKLINW